MDEMRLVVAIVVVIALTWTFLRNWRRDDLYDHTVNPPARGKYFMLKTKSSAFVILVGSVKTNNL